MTLTGIVKNPANKPVKNASITIRNLKDEILYEEISNRKGFFKFDEIEPKFYYLLIKHETEGSKRIKLNPKKFIAQEQLAGNKYRAISDFISGMTDRYAINLNKNFK